MSIAPVRRVPGRLDAPEPGWTTTADVVVIGSGIAGLTAALRLRGHVEKGLVVTKDVLAARSPQGARGGGGPARGGGGGGAGPPPPPGRAPPPPPPGGGGPPWSPVPGPATPR